eukprot:SAG11_NODE_914_length_6565_cov_8.318126_5_plen_41_part_00
MVAVVAIRSWGRASASRFVSVEADREVLASRTKAVNGLED